MHTAALVFVTALTLLSAGATAKYTASLAWVVPACSGEVTTHFAAAVEIVATECPAGAAGCVVVACMDGTVALLNAMSGAIIWATHVPGAVRSTPSAASGAIVVTTVDSTCFALDARTGKLRWTWQSPRPSWIFFSTIDVHRGLVMIGLREGPSVLLDLDSGAPRCHLAHTDGVWGPPLLDLDRGLVAVAMTASSRVVAALHVNPALSCTHDNPPIGKPLVPSWESDISPGVERKAKRKYWVFGGPVLMGDDTVVVGVSDGSLRELRLSDGKEVLKRTVAPGSPITAPLVVSRDRRRLCGVSEDGTMFSVSRSEAYNHTSTLRTWRASAPQAAQWASKSGVVVGSDRDVFIALEAPGVGSFLVTASIAEETAAEVLMKLPKGCAARSTACFGCGQTHRSPGLTVVVGCQNGTWVALRLAAPQPVAKESTVWSSAGRSSSSGGGIASDIAWTLLAAVILYSIALRRARARVAIRSAQPRTG